jgi:hypothetical protein
MDGKINVSEVVTRGFCGPYSDTLSAAAALAKWNGNLKPELHGTKTNRE